MSAVALIVASGAAAALNCLLFWNLNLFPLAFVIILVVAALLGLPTYLVRRSMQKDGVISALISGFVIGAGVPFLLVVTMVPDSASIGDTATVVNGSYTVAGWVDNLEMVGLFGLIGACGGLTFWLVIRSPVPSQAPRNQSSKPGFWSVFSVLSATGIIASPWLIPYVTADRSCHNPLRDGGRSISAAAGFDLHVDIDQWATLSEELKTFGRSGHWSTRSDVRPDPDSPWLQISLCRETGTDIFAMNIPPSSQISFVVYQPQGGSSWRREFRALYRRLDARWPGRITFISEDGQVIAAPDWARGPITSGDLNR